MHRFYFLLLNLGLLVFLGCSESPTPESAVSNPQATTPTDGSEPELLEEGP